MADIALKDAPVLSSLKITDRVTIMAADTGHQIASMTVGEFVKQMVELMPAATASKNGLITSVQAMRLNGMVHSHGVSGGGSTMWVHVGHLSPAYYYPYRLEVVVGPWNSTKTFITISINNAPVGRHIQVKEYSGNLTNVVGYVVYADQTLSVYVRCRPSDSVLVTAWSNYSDYVRLGGIQEIYTEPAGIVYMGKP